MRKGQEQRLKRDAKNLQDILKELDPYLERPSVIEPSTKGRWVRGDGKYSGRTPRIPETQQANN